MTDAITNVMDGTHLYPTQPVNPSDIRYERYIDESQLQLMNQLIQQDLSEPYSIYTYRYFLHTYPNLSILAMYNSQCIGCIIGSINTDNDNNVRGYIGMLTVNKLYRKQNIGITLVKLCIQQMIEHYSVQYIMLEAESENHKAMKLYEKLGFIRDRILYKYYLNGSDAYRLKLWLTNINENQQRFYQTSDEQCGS